jgi:hypothetical protein
MTYWHPLYLSEMPLRPADAAGHHAYLHNTHTRADRRHITAVSWVLSTRTATHRCRHRSCYCGPRARGLGWADSRKVLEAVMPPASWRSGWPQRQRAGQQRAHTESRGCVASHVSRPAPPFRCDWAWYLRQHGPHTCTQYRRTTLALHRGARGVQAALAQQRGAWRAAAASFTWATTSLPPV